MTRGGGGEEKLGNLLGLLKPYLHPTSAAPQQDVLGLLERAKQLFPQAAPAAGSEIKPIADMLGGIMTQSLAADAKKAEAAAEMRKAEIQAGRASEVPTQRRDREPPPLVHVAGLGMVHVVAPEARLTYADAPAPPTVQAVAAPAAHVPAPSAAPSLPAAAPVALSAPVEPVRPPSAPRSLVSEAEPSPLVVAAAPPAVAAAEPAIEMPAEVLAVVQQVTQNVTDDDRAALAGAIGRMDRMTSAERVSVVQRIFPMISVGEAEKAAEMLLHLPMPDISRMIFQLPPEDVARANHSIGLGRSKPPEG